MDSDKSSPLTIGFVGSSHLSIVSAVTAAKRAASKAFPLKVVIFHQRPVFNTDGNFSIFEEGLDEAYQSHKEQISFTENLENLSKCHIIYFAEDVPTDDKGESNLEPIKKLMDSALPFIDSNSIVVIHNQVEPGFTRTYTNKIDPRNLFYQVETLIFGQAVQRAFSPERYIIGANEPGKALPDNLKAYLDIYECPQFIMNYESAELSKIAINLYLISQVTTTNILAEICENIGANWYDIAPTLRLDKRIGPHAYLKPGLGLSGGNLERDLASIGKISRTYGTYSKQITAQIKDNLYRKQWVLHQIKKNVFVPTTQLSIGILGIVYKPGTSSLKNTPSLKVMSDLACAKNLYAYDPNIQSLPSDFPVNLCQSAEEVLQNVDILILLTPLEEFKLVDYKAFKGCILDVAKIITNKDAPSAKIIHIGDNLC